MIEPHLRRLGNVVHQLAQPLLAFALFIPIINAKRACKNNRHAAARVRFIPLRQLTLNLNPSNERMIQIVPHLLLNISRPFQERTAGCRINSEQRKRRKIADDSANLRMKRETVELGQVDCKSGISAPRCKRLGISRQQHSGRRQSGLGRFLAKPDPCAALQAGIETAEALPRDGFRTLCQLQIGSRGQRIQTA
ncbi:hypothetical protein D3C81_946070 [compost metagenome]